MYRHARLGQQQSRRIVTSECCNVIYLNILFSDPHWRNDSMKKALLLGAGVLVLALAACSKTPAPKSTTPAVSSSSTSMSTTTTMMAPKASTAVKAPGMTTKHGAAKASSKS